MKDTNIGPACGVAGFAISDGEFGLLMLPVVRVSNVARYW
jgi:hypothetical protein